MQKRKQGYNTQNNQTPTLGEERLIRSMNAIVNGYQKKILAVTGLDFSNMKVKDRLFISEKLNLMKKSFSIIKADISKPGGVKEDEFALAYRQFDEAYEAVKKRFNTIKIGLKQEERLNKMEDVASKIDKSHLEMRAYWQEALIKLRTKKNMILSNSEDSRLDSKISRIVERMEEGINKIRSAILEYRKSTTESGRAKASAHYSEIKMEYEKNLANLNKLIPDVSSFIITEHGKGTKVASKEVVKKGVVKEVQKGASQNQIKHRGLSHE